MRFSFPRLPALRVPTPGRRFSDTSAFDKTVSAVFRKVAVNGVIDEMALVVAMCHLHFKLKKHVPGVTRTPTREAVQEVLGGFDANRDGVLDEAEFHRFAKEWWDNTGAIWVYRAALVSAVTFVAVPELAAAARLKFPHGTDVPKGVWVAAAGLLFKAVSTAVAARMERADA